jgi:hypothetical protein
MSNSRVAIYVHFFFGPFFFEIVSQGHRNVYEDPHDDLDVVIDPCCLIHLQRLGHLPHVPQSVPVSTDSDSPCGEFKLQQRNGYCSQAG